MESPAEAGTDAAGATPGASAMERLGPLATLIAAGWLGTNLGLGVGEFTLKFFLKDHLHLTANGIASFFLWGQFVNYIKPVAGVLCDSVPLFHTRRRWYLLLSLLGTGVFWLLLAATPASVGVMLAVYFVLYTTVVFTSTSLGGVMVEVGERYKAAGRLTAQRIAMFRLGTLGGQPLGGYLAGFPFIFAAGAASVLHLVLVPLFFFFLPEKPTAALDTSVWRKTERHLRLLLQSRTLLTAAGMVFLLAASPGFNTPLLFYQTDTLHFSKQFVGYLGLISSAFGLLGSGLYYTVCRRLNLRWLLTGSIVVHSLGTLFYLGYHDHASAQVVTAISGITVTLATLPIYDLAARATPRGIEAIGYAVMMSVWNLTNALSDKVGSYLFTKYHLVFGHLVWLNAGTTALVLLAMPLLPQVIVNSCDGDELG